MAAHVRSRSGVALLFALFLCCLAAAPPLPAATVRGTAFAPQEKPIPGVAVTLSGGAGEARTATTDANGRYAFADVPPGRYTVVARKQGLGAQRQAVEVARPDQIVGVYFRLQPWSAEPWSVTGTVFRPDGKTPLGGAEVRLYRERLPSVTDEAGETTTDETGSYAFIGLKPSSYRLSVSAPGHVSSWGQEFLLREGSDRKEIDVTLQLPPPHTVPGTVVGEVLDAAGQPLVKGDVRVWINGDSVDTRMPWGEGMSRRSWGSRGRSAPGRMDMDLRGRVKTDDAGKFRFTFPPGTYTLKVWLPTFLSQTQPLKVEPSAEGLPLSFRLTPGDDPVAAEERPQPAPPRGRLNARVLRPDGTPLTNTGVYLFVAPNIGTDDRPWNHSYQGLSEAYVTTDAEGRLVKDDLQPGPALVAAKTRGFAETPATRVELAAGAVAEVEMRLPAPSTHAEGRVVADDGKPVAGARVYAYHVIGRWEDDDFWSRLQGGWWGRDDVAGPWPFDARVEDLKPGVVPGLLTHGIIYAETDAEGRFVLKELDTGGHHFGATMPGYSKESQKQVALRADAAAPNLTFTLKQLGAVEGTVLRPDGTPLATQEVGMARTFAAPGGGQSTHGATVTTNGAGAFRLPDLEANTYDLEVAAPGFARARQEKVVVRPGATTGGVTFRLQAGISLRGRVLKPDGTPAGGALVRWADARQGERGAATSAADGTFELKGLDPGDGFIGARLAGFAPTVEKATIPQVKDAPLDLKLQAVVPVRGKVRDKEGKPIEGAYVFAWRSYEPGFRFDDPPRGAQSGPEGDYVLAEVPRARVQISASKEGYGNASAAEDLSAREGEVVVDFTLERLRYGKLRGRVLRADGTPAAGVSLWVSVERANGARVTTNEEGVYVCERIASGTARVNVQTGMQEPPEPIQVAPDAETVAPDIRLAAAGILEGKISGLDRLPGGGQAAATFSMDLPSPGAQAGTENVRVYLATPQPGTGSPVPEALRRATQRIQWVLATSAGFCGLLGSGTRWGGHAPIQPDGAFRMDRAQVGTGRLVVQWSRGRDGYVSLDVAAAAVTEGRTTRVDAAVPPCGSIAGSVSRPANAPAAEGSMVCLVRRTPFARTAMAPLRGDGTYQLSGVPAGDYAAMVWEPGLAPVQRPLTVRTGETATLNLDLVPGVALGGKVEGERPKELFVSVESDGSFGGTQVGDDGTFKVEHLLPGTCTLRLWRLAGLKAGKTQTVEVGPAGVEGVVARWEPVRADGLPGQ